MPALTAVAVVQGAVTTGGEVFVFERERATRFGVMPRNAKSGKEVRWYEMESMFAFHVANAWQEGPLIKLYAAISQEVCALARILPYRLLSPPFLSPPSSPLFFSVYVCVREGLRVYVVCVSVCVGGGRVRVCTCLCAHVCEWGVGGLPRSASLLVIILQTGAPTTCRTHVVFAALVPAQSSSCFPPSDHDFQTSSAFRYVSL
jgi:hypothetical protein